MNDNRPIPSPTYSHISQADSQAQSSPYSMAQTVMLPGTSTYHVGYPTLSGSHLAPMPYHSFRYQHSPQPYYPNGEGDVYPHASSSQCKVSPAYEHRQLEAQQQHHQAFENGSTPLLTTSTLSRSHDTTIPQYYPITTDSRWISQMTPDKSESAQKRKRDRGTGQTPSSVSTGLSTPKRAKSPEEAGAARPNKRVKIEKDRAATAQPPIQNQLPTPPSTGREMSYVSLPQHVKVHPPTENHEADQIGPSTIKRRGVKVTRHQEEGRRLGLVSNVSAEIEEPATPEEAQLSPRLKSIPALLTDDSGIAVFTTDEVLETEVAWLMNGGRVQSPPSSPDLVQLQTPTLDQDAIVMVNDSPASKEAKVSKRLELFNDAVKLDEPMVCTRVDLFGRVAVRKDVAIKFLGLDTSARVIEETRSEGEDQWSEMSVVGSSKMIRPNWPDTEAPWATAGGNKKEKRQKEEEHKVATLRRYLETASDESSDEESAPVSWARGQGKSAQRLSELQIRPKRLDSPNSDARAALLTAIRNRVLPVLPAGKIACACGATSPVDMGPMIECSGCKTWHHLACCGIDDDTVIGPQWWCPRCSADAIAMSTPARATPRSYAQSAERSSAFKGEMANIALAPSPMFVNPATFAQAAAATRTPLNRVLASPASRQRRSRILSYGTDMWTYEDGAPSSAAPSTPGPSRMNRFSTPRLDDAPFDVTSTPSRHLDFSFGQPSLFALTPLGGRGRVSAGGAGGMLVDGTPYSRRAGRPSMPMTQPLSEMIPSRHDFFRELNKGPMTEMPASPQTRWPHALLGAHNVSPSPFGGHRKSINHLSSVSSAAANTNKTSSLRSSQRSGLGLGMSPVPNREE